MYIIKDLCYSYIGDKGTDVLKGISLEIKEGDFVVFQGISGSGKTTLLNLLSNLDIPTSGTIFFKGKDLQKMSDQEASIYRLSKIGIVFQSQNLIPNLTVFENIEVPLGLYGVNPKERKELVIQLLEKFGLFERKDHFPNQLSGGERKRVAIARALANKPRVLLVDEPATGLDEKNVNIVMDTLEALNEEGISLIVASHLESVIKRAKKIIKLHEGILIN